MRTYEIEPFETDRTAFYIRRIKPTISERMIFNSHPLADAILNLEKQDDWGIQPQEGKDENKGNFKSE